MVLRSPGRAGAVRSGRESRSGIGLNVRARAGSARWEWRAIGASANVDEGRGFARVPRTRRRSRRTTRSRTPERGAGTRRARDGRPDGRVAGLSPGAGATSATPRTCAARVGGGAPSRPRSARPGGRRDARGEERGVVGRRRLDVAHGEEARDELLDEGRGVGVDAEPVRRDDVVRARGERREPGQEKSAKFPTLEAHISVVFHSFRLIFGRAIISRSGLDAWMLFPERARAEHSC